MVLGLGLIGSAVLSLCLTLPRDLAFLFMGATTEGVVTHVEEASRRSRAGGVTYFTPAVRFTTTTGAVQHFKAFSQSRSYVVAGETVAVVFLPSRPHIAQIRAWTSLYSPMLFGLLLPLLPLAAGGYLFVRGMKARRLARF
jgi:hypothetical protein